MYIFYKLHIHKFSFKNTQYVFRGQRYPFNLTMIWIAQFFLRKFTRTIIIRCREISLQSVGLQWILPEPTFSRNKREHYRFPDLERPVLETTYGRADARVPYREPAGHPTGGLEVEPSTFTASTDKHDAFTVGNRTCYTRAIAHN